MLGANGQLGAKYARFETIPATYWLTTNYNENQVLLNEEIRRLPAKPMLLGCKNIGFEVRNHSF